MMSLVSRISNRINPPQITPAPAARSSIVQVAQKAATQQDVAQQRIILSKQKKALWLNALAVVVLAVIAVAAAVIFGPVSLPIAITATGLFAISAIVVTILTIRTKRRIDQELRNIS